jgi:hypothetical protein
MLPRSLTAYPAPGGIDNRDNGVLVFGTRSTGNVVLGNFIGTSADGAAALGNLQWGISVDSAANTTIGGTTAAARNVISPNSAGGIVISGASATNIRVLGNYIGTDATGTRGFTFAGTGVSIGGGASNNQIGGTGAAEGNIISANDHGVIISGSDTTTNVVQGNYIGTDVTGEADLGNLSYGVRVSAPNNQIGGPDPAQATSSRRAVGKALSWREAMPPGTWCRATISAPTPRAPPRWATVPESWSAPGPTRTPWRGTLLPATAATASPSIT